jgi:hypothetical protein
VQSRNARGAAGVVGPAAYAAWRATVLGSITESIEQRLIPDLAGEVRGRRAQSFDNDVDLRRVLVGKNAAALRERAARVDPHHRVPSDAAPRAAG